MLFLQGIARLFPQQHRVKSPQNHYQRLSTYPSPQPYNHSRKGSLLFKEGKCSRWTSHWPSRKYHNSRCERKTRCCWIAQYFWISAKKSRSRRRSYYTADREGYYWSDHIRADYNSIEDYTYKKGEAADFRKAGFGVVNTHRPEGIHRGTGVCRFKRWKWRPTLARR